jgi:hypothetical protein
LTGRFRAGQLLVRLTEFMGALQERPRRPAFAGSVNGMPVFEEES